MINKFKTFIFNDYPTSWQLGFQNPATPVMEGIINLHNYIFMYLILVTVVVSWFLFRSLYLFRKSKNSESLVFNHDPVIETVWTIAPAFILVAIAVPSFSLLYSMDEVINPALTVKAIGHQWYWSYELDASRKDALFDYAKIKHPFFKKLSLKELSNYHHGFIKSMKNANFDFEKRVKLGKLHKSGAIVRIPEIWEWDKRLNMDVLIRFAREAWVSNPISNAKSSDKLIEASFIKWKSKYPTFKLGKGGIKFVSNIKAFYKPVDHKHVAYSLTEAIDASKSIKFKPSSKTLKKMTAFETVFKFKPKVIKHKTLAELKAAKKPAHTRSRPSQYQHSVFNTHFSKLFIFKKACGNKNNFIEAKISNNNSENFSVFKHFFSDIIKIKRAKFISLFEFTTTRYRYAHSIMWISPQIKFDSYMLPEEALPKGGFRLLEVDNRLILPINTNIRILVTSTDVIHSWSIPSLGIKLDAVPGRLNQTSLFIKREGVFYGQCSELCGINHGFMPIVIEAVIPREFNRWVLANSNPKSLSDLINSQDWEVRVSGRSY